MNQNIKWLLIGICLSLVGCSSDDTKNCPDRLAFVINGHNYQTSCEILGNVDPTDENIVQQLYHPEIELSIPNYSPKYFIKANGVVIKKLSDRETQLKIPGNGLVKLELCDSKACLGKYLNILYNSSEVEVPKNEISNSLNGNSKDSGNIENGQQAPITSTTSNSVQTKSTTQNTQEPTINTINSDRPKTNLSFKQNESVNEESDEINNDNEPKQKISDEIVEVQQTNNAKPAIESKTLKDDNQVSKRLFEVKRQLIAKDLFLSQNDLKDQFENIEYRVNNNLESYNKKSAVLNKLATLSKSIESYSVPKMIDKEELTTSTPAEPAKESINEKIETPVEEIKKEKVIKDVVEKEELIKETAPTPTPAPTPIKEEPIVEPVEVKPEMIEDLAFEYKKSQIGILASNRCNDNNFASGPFTIKITPKRDVKLEKFRIFSNENGTASLTLNGGSIGSQTINDIQITNRPEGSPINIYSLAGKLKKGETYTLTLKTQNSRLESASTCGKPSYTDSLITIEYGANASVFFDFKFIY